MISWSASGMSNGSLPACACSARKNAMPAIAMLMVGPCSSCQATMPPVASVPAFRAPTTSATTMTGSTESSIIISRELPTEA